MDDAGGLRSRLLAAEHARVEAPAHRAAVARGLNDVAPAVRVLAVRAAGRTRRAEFLPAAMAALRDPSIDVRREAAFAVAHIGSETPDAVPAAAAALRDAIDRDADALVLAALVENVGRLPYQDAADVERAVAASRAGVAKLPTGGSLVTLGAARAAEALARRTARLKASAPSLLQWLTAMTTTGLPISTPGRPDPIAARVRRLALTGLLSLDAVPADLARGALADPDAQVRRLAVVAAARLPAAVAADAAALAGDPSVLVRHAVVTRLGPSAPGLVTTALGDAHVQVRLAALDVLGRLGACREACVGRLTKVDAFDEANWHEAAHALVALARTSPETARAHVTPASAASTWQVRMYAARAAGVTGQPDVLRALAADPHVNVRHAALVAWREAGLPGLAQAAVAALATDDGQLLLEAATALKGATMSADDVTALRAAVRRLTAQRRDTARDPRLALLERLDEHDPHRDAVLREALTDFDPVVASRAAALLNARRPTGAAAAQAAPTPATPRATVRVPTADQVRALEGATVSFTFRGGRSMVIRLFPQVAPVAVARLVDQVRAGQWSGRTFHRVEPGFVVQGGSPAANEYAGADAFARDEFSGLSHVRGAVGISTRGPDTGDGQLFLNLVDNARLDFAYTVIGAVAGDSAILDDLLEGEVVVSAVVTPAP